MEKNIRTLYIILIAITSQFLIYTSYVLYFDNSKYIILISLLVNTVILNKIKLNLIVKQIGSFPCAVINFTLIIQLISILDVSIFGDRQDSWPMQVPIQDNLVYLYIRAEIIKIIGITVLIYGWSLGISRSINLSGFHLVSISKKSIIKLLAIYLFGLISQFLIKKNIVSAIELSQVLHILYLLSISIIFVLLTQMTRGKILTGLILGLPFSIIAFTGGLKEHIFLPFLPLCIIIWQSLSSSIIKLLFISTCLVILTIAQLFVSVTRQESWGQNINVSATDLVEKTLAVVNEEVMTETFNIILSRLNAQTSHAISLGISDRDGFQPEEIFGNIPASFIPRIIWPNKPVLMPGKAHYKKITGQNVEIEEITSSSAPGFLFEIYIGGGFIALILFTAVFGMTIGFFQRLLIKFYEAPIVLMMNFIIFYTALRLEELAVVYSITGIIFNFIFIFALFKIINIKSL